MCMPASEFEGELRSTPYAANILIGAGGLVGETHAIRAGLTTLLLDKPSPYLAYEGDAAHRIW